MSQDNPLKLNRRQFLSTALGSVGYATLAGALVSCSTIDDFLIEDQFDFNEEVVIIGGGIAGLYAAYELKKNKIPFKIFEATDRLGGKIKTVNGFEWGAFEFHKNDRILKALAREFNLETVQLPSDKWAFKKGAQQLINEMVDVTQGLIPERQIRLKHQLISMKKIGSRYQLTFKIESRERMFFARKVILALPHQSVVKMSSLNDISSLKPLYQQLSRQPVEKLWTNIRVNIFYNQLNDQFKSRRRFNSEAIEAAFYKLTTLQTAQIDIQQNDFKTPSQVIFTFRMTADHPLRPIQHLESFMQRLTHKDFELNSENCKDWGSEYLDSRSFQAVDLKLYPQPQEKLKLFTESMVSISDGPYLPKSSASVSSIESLLRIIQPEIQSFTLDI